MSQFSAGITALNSESKFAKAYSDGVKKSLYWEVRNGENIHFNLHIGHVLLFPCISLDETTKFQVFIHQ